MKRMKRTPASDPNRREAQLTVRIPTYLREALDHDAETQRRSVADMIVFMLEAKYGRAKGGK